MQDSKLRVTSVSWDTLSVLNITYFDNGGNYFDRDFFINEDDQVVFKENEV
jgi:hypothetical protein